jgi:hypothetical protein
VFHPDGAFSHAFGKRGEGPGELDAPWGVLLAWISTPAICPDLC